MSKLNKAEISIPKEGTISADDLEAELGYGDWRKLNIPGNGGTKPSTHFW